MISQILLLVSVLIAVGGGIALFVVAARRDQKLFFVSWIFPFMLLVLLDSADGRKAWAIFALGLLLPFVFQLLGLLR